MFDDNDNDLNTSPSDDDEIPAVDKVDEGLANEPQFEEPIASPAVSDEESPLGDAASSEPLDIDAAMDQLGIDHHPDREDQ